MKIFYLIGLLLATCPEPTCKMEISYVNMDIDTIISVDCDKFEDYFGSTIKTISISEPEIIENVWQLIQELVLADTMHTSPDTRMKMKIWKGKTMYTACIDRNLILFNGKMYIHNDEIRRVIEEIIENHAEK